MIESNSTHSFLEKSDEYVIKKLKNLNKYVDISSDDEIWLFQCPKTVDPSNIIERTIKLPGKSNIDDSEIVTELSNRPITLSLAVLQESKFNFKSIKIQGTMVMKKKIDVKKDELENQNFRKTKLRVPFPKDIKERHPLFGPNYEKNICLPKSVVDRLKEVSALTRFAKIERSHKSSKKNKRKQKLFENDNVAKYGDIVPNKEIKIELCDNDPSLDWLKNI